MRLRRPSAKPVTKLVVPADLQGLNVLVVDDLADSRTIMRKMLATLDFKVETLDSGPKALNRLQDHSLCNHPIDLIMMDWKMPAMDGIEVSKKIRQELRLTMPIIMMTAFGKEEQRIEAEKAGINGFLTKPIYPSTLFDAIMDGFGKAGGKAAGRKKQFTTRASIYRKPLKGIRILVAEDNFTNQQVAQAILEGAGIVVTIVGDGEAAVQAVGNTPFDAVLMDIQMPRMNGYEATRRIRELPQGASMPIVAMTAHAMKGDEEKCLEAGMDGYISKPVNQDRLFHTLWRLLRVRRHLSDGLAPEEDEFSADPKTDGGEIPQDEHLVAFENSLEKDGLHATTLPGIDIAQTLAALHLDGPTFLRILIGFRADNRETAQQLRQAFTVNDPERISQLAHGLKGSAANIGATELNRTAQALEDACRDFPAAVEPARLEGLIANVASALDQVLESIRSLEESGTSDAAETISAETGPPVDALCSSWPKPLTGRIRNKSWKSCPPSGSRLPDADISIRSVSKRWKTRSTATTMTKRWRRSGRFAKVDRSPMNASRPLVLIVDDNATNLDLLVNTLKTEYRLGIAKNGPNALKYAVKHKPGLVLLDIMMPEMDGYEVCSG